MTPEDEEFEAIAKRQAHTQRAEEALAKQEQGEPVIEIEFLDWVHPKLGVMPVEVEGKRPLILRAKLKEKNHAT